jgi:hypothetical protein
MPSSAEAMGGDTRWILAGVAPPWTTIFFILLGANRR